MKEERRSGEKAGGHDSDSTFLAKSLWLTNILKLKKYPISSESSLASFTRIFAYKTWAIGYMSNKGQLLGEKNSVLPLPKHEPEKHNDMVAREECSGQAGRAVPALRKEVSRRGRTLRLAVAC